MDEHEQEHEELRRRLRAMGEHPMDLSLQSAHLTAIAQLPPSRPSLVPKLRLAGIFLAGLLIGSSGLAVAGALPDPAQHAAHSAFNAVGVDVPDPARYHGPECGTDVKRNHGAYVRDDHSLAGSRCGKPIKAGQGGKDEAGDGPGAKAGCQGPPPWAGKDKHAMAPEEKAADKAERKATCGAEEKDAEADEPEQQDATTTTTTTTDSAASSSTTEPPVTTTTTEAEVTTTSTPPTTEAPAG